MSSDPAVDEACGQLVTLVTVMMDPVTSPAARREAFEKAEAFKAGSPYVVQCALVLSAQGQGPYVRHFGLKLLEDVIRLRWNQLSPQEKLFLKENVMRLMDSGVGDILLEAPHVKDGISRLTVEIAKREWPQQWPTLLQELDGLCQKGPAQTEMVMLVLLRLVEDVALLQTLEQSQRRKEIYAALTQNMEAIFAFLLQHLEKHYLLLNSSPKHGVVAKSVLHTFSVFVEWVGMQHIMSNDKYLVRCLCHLLSNEVLQLQAAECLCSIVAWKAGKILDRIQLLCLFTEEMMAPLFAATERANARALEEDHYLFLKRMVAIFCELGKQLADIWSETKGQKRPENFQTYLSALLAFASHPSHSINSPVFETWNRFLRHPGISTDETFRAFVPKWVEQAVRKAVKVGIPSKEDHPSCAYSALDFDSDEEFSSFFGRFRVLVLEGLRLISADNPAVPFNATEASLRAVLSALPPPNSDAPFLTADSEVYLRIDAAANALDCVFARQTQMQVQLPGASALAKQLVEFCSPDPMLTSALLSCLSALFPVIAAEGEVLLMPAMNKIFSCITSTGGQKSARDLPNGERMLRRHGCALLVKVATRQPRVLLGMFDHLRDSIVDMRKREQILQSEYSTLVEALILISNELHNFAVQSNFLKTISEPVCIQMRNLESAISSPAAFISFTGMDKPLVPYETDPCASNRVEVGFCLNFVLAVVRRANTPGDIQSCRSGGFLLSESATHAALRNPGSEVGSTTLSTALLLMKTLTGLWSPEGRAKLHPDFAKALDMLGSEKNSVSGMGSRQEAASKEAVKSPLAKFQLSIYEMFENVYHFLTQLSTSCGYDFYGQPALAEGLVNTCLHGLDPLPDFRLRAVNRFIKNLVNKAPKMYYSQVLAPVLQTYCPYMLSRLCDRWKHLSVVRESPSYDEDNAESQEVVDDVVCRHLSREYLDVVKAILTSGDGSDIPLSSLKKPSSPSSRRNSSSSTNGATADDTPVKNGGGNNSGNGPVVLSELGRLVLGHESLGQCIILTLLRGLVWPDSPSSVRAASLLETVLPTLVQSGQLSVPDANQVMVAILSAIHELGQHELNYISLIQLAISAYEWMRPKYPGIVDVLKQVPGCNTEDVDRFDARMLTILQGKENGTNGSGAVNPTKGYDRVKKDMFKKIIGSFIGKEVAHLFRHDVVIKNLPTIQLLKPARHKTPSLDEQEKTDIGLGSLFGT